MERRIRAAFNIARRLIDRPELVDEIPDAGEVKICRYGHQHSGDYAYSEWLQCQCDHQYPDMIEYFEPDESPLWKICLECGKTWTREDQ